MSLTLELIERSFPHEISVDSLLSSLEGIIHVHEEDSYLFLKDYIANFREKNLEIEKNYTHDEYFKNINKIINDKKITIPKFNQFLMGTVDVDVKELKNLFTKDITPSFNFVREKADDIIFDERFEKLMSEAVDFTQDNKEHEFLSICSVFIEQMDDQSVEKIKSDIEKNNFNPIQFLKQIEKMSILDFKINEKNGKLTYESSPSGLPDAMFFNPQLSSLEKLKVTTVAATLDKGTNVEGNSMFRHTASSLCAIKQIHKMLKDRDFNSTYNDAMVFFDHFKNTEDDMMINLAQKNILMSLHNLGVEFSNKKSITFKDWNKEIKPRLNEIINHDGNLMSFSLENINRRIDEKEEEKNILHGNPTTKHFDEHIFANKYANLKGYRSWSEYIKNKSSYEKTVENMIELNCKENRNDKRITKLDMQKFARDMKMNGLDTFFVGKAAFQKTNKTHYYENVEKEMNLTPVELRLGINIAAYASEFSGYAKGFSIEPGAGLDFISQFNIRANVKSKDVDGEKITKSMNKIHQFLLDEYIFNDYSSIIKNDIEDDYILENISKFKSSFYDSIANLIDEHDCSPKEAFERYTKELNCTLPENFSLKELINTEKEVINGSFVGSNIYAKDFKNMYKSIKIHKKNILLKEKDYELKEKDYELKEKDDIDILNQALLTETMKDVKNAENALPEDRVDLKSILSNIKKDGLDLDGYKKKIDKKVFLKYKEEKRDIAISEEDGDFLNNLNKSKKRLSTKKGKNNNKLN